MQTGIEWRSTDNQFPVTYMEVKLTSPLPSEYSWQLQTKNIENFQLVATSKEKEHLDELLSLVQWVGKVVEPATNAKTVDQATANGYLVEDEDENE